MGRNTELRAVAMDACLELSKEACAIFDALEAGPLTMDTARAVVRMGELAADIALGVRALVITGG